MNNIRIGTFLFMTELVYVTAYPRTYYGHNIGWGGAIIFGDILSCKTILYFYSDLVIFNKYNLN
jgi:hypothetical protein